VKFVGWLREHGKKGFVGELAGGRNDKCNTAVTNMLTYIEDNGDVLEGWMWWAAGPGWGDYMFTLEPKGGVDRPQMALLAPFLAK
jgi:endoglucanase